MSHYYTNEETPDVPSSFTFDIAGRTYDMQSNAGVFSKDKLDEGTRKSIPFSASILILIYQK